VSVQDQRRKTKNQRLNVAERFERSSLVFRLSSCMLALIRMSRPAILPSGALAYSVGIALAVYEQLPLPWPAICYGLLVTMLANLAAHYADEYADRDTDALSSPTWVSGGSGTLAAGTVQPMVALRAAWVTSSLVLVLIALGFVAALLPPLACLVALLGLAGGWLYSVPPIWLERRGLGEITNALLGGLLMPLMAYLCAGGLRVSWACVALLPVVAAVMVCVLGVHWPDRGADAAVGKRTLAVIFAERSRALHASCATLAHGLPLLLAGTILPLPVALGTLASLPLTLWAANRYSRSESPLPGAAAMVGFMLVYGAAFCLFMIQTR
jgi:1,4-dihydroxy-2-naphthoate polyprenyltransferase